MLTIYIDAHKISRLEIEKEEWKLIQDKLEKRISYDVIKSKQPTKDELSIARSVTTNLKALKDNEIESLIKQAATLTEIQIKLYCPILID